MLTPKFISTYEDTSKKVFKSRRFEIYTRWCDRCKTFFETPAKYGKVCPNCRVHWYTRKDGKRVQHRGGTTAMLDNFREHGIEIQI